MADKTILEYLAKTDDLVLKLNQIIQLGGDVQKNLNRNYVLKLQTNEAIQGLLSAQKTLVNLQLNASKGLNVKISPQFQQQLNFLHNRVTSLIPALQNVQPAAAKASGGISSLGSSFSRLNHLVNILIFNRIAQSLIDIGKQSVNTAVELEALTNAFTAVLGSAEEADKKLLELRETADTFGKSFLDVTENFLRFKIAGDAAKLTAGQTQGIFDALIVTSAGLNQSSAELNRTFTAFEQILSKGILSAEEIRRQLGNALPGAFSITARAIGVTNEELEKMLRRGEVLSSEVAPKIAEELLRTFGPAAIANVTSARAEFARFGNDLLDVRKVIGDALLPSLLDIVRTLQKIKEEEGLTGLADAAKIAGISLERLTKVITARSIPDALGAIVESFADIQEIFQPGTVDIIAKSLGLTDEQTRKAKENAQGYVDKFKDIAVAISSHGKNFIDAGRLAQDYNDQANKAFSRTLERLKEVNNETKKLKEIEAVTKGLPDHFRKIAQELLGIRDDINAFTDSTGKLKEGLDPAIIANFADRIVELRLNLESAANLPPAITALFEKLENQLGETAIQASLLNVALKKLGADTPNEIKATTVEFEAYLNAVKESGSVTREQADLITKSAKDILESIKKLPSGQRVAFKDLENSLSSVLVKYKGFTTEAAKEAEKLRKETAKSFSDLAEELSDIFLKLRETISGQEKEGTVARDLRELQEEFDNLNRKATLSGDEMARFEELLSLIPAKQAELAGAIKASFDAVNVDVAKAFENMILGNDKLIEGIARLPPTAQSAFLSLVNNFSELSQTSKITENDLQNFGTALANIFQGAGVSLEGFVAKLSDTATLTQKIRAEIVDAQKEIASAAAGKTGEENQSIAGQQAISNIESNADALFLLSQGWNNVSESIRNNTRDTGKSQQEVKALSEEYERIKKFLKEHKQAIDSGIVSNENYRALQERLVQITDELTKSNSEYEVGLENLDTEVRISSDGLITYLTALEPIVPTLADVAEETRRAREEMEPITDQARILKNTTDDLNIVFEKNTGISAERAAALERNAEAIEGLRQRQGDLIDATGEFNDQVSQSVENVDALANSTTNAATSTDKAAQEISDNFDPVQTRLTNIRDTLKEIVEKLMPQFIEQSINLRNAIEGGEPNVQPVSSH